MWGQEGAGAGTTGAGCLVSTGDNSWDLGGGLALPRDPPLPPLLDKCDSPLLAMTSSVVLSVVKCSEVFKKLISVGVKNME